MNRAAIIFGGSGYIGTNLIKHCLQNNVFDKFYVFDIKPLVGFETQIEEDKVAFHEVDVRSVINITIDNLDIDNSWVFNLAAIHREPGHNFQEYFDTNIPGAENINEFARKNKIQNIFFTSSIAPYGKSHDQKSEDSKLYPETAYGISKAIAEKTHQIWLSEDTNRRLIIVRPSVIFGPKDPGNVYRMIKALKRGSFILPDGGNIIKAYGYVFGLIESFVFTINKSKNEKFIIYNYAENPVVPLIEMVAIIKSELKINKPILKLPVKLLVIVAWFFQLVFKLIGKKSDIHPVRVRKAGFPTNIKPQYLINNGFEFKYDLKNSLIHWQNVSPEDFLG